MVLDIFREAQGVALSSRQIGGVLSAELQIRGGA